MTLVEFPLENGSSMIVDVGDRQPDPGSVVRRGFGSGEAQAGIAVRAGETLETAFVAHTAGEPNFQVSLRWKRDKSSSV